MANSRAWGGTRASLMRNSHSAKGIRSSFLRLQSVVCSAMEAIVDRLLVACAFTPKRAIWLSSAGDTPEPVSQGRKTEIHQSLGCLQPGLFTHLRPRRNGP